MLLASGGCAWLGIRNSYLGSPQRGDPPVDCTVHPAVPVVDAVAASLFLGFGGFVVGADQTSSSHSEVQGVATVIVGVPALLIGALYAGSAVHGFHENRDCREAIREQAAVESNQIARYYCTASTGGHFGSCSETEVGCAHERVVFSARHQMSDCALKLEVSCFGYSSVDGATHVACTPSDESCAALNRGFQGQLGVSSIETCEDRIEAKPVPERLPESRPSLPDHEETLREATTLTKAAEEAAQAGDCARVAHLEATVRGLDADFHDTVFVRNVAIARCSSAEPAPGSPQQ